MPNILGHVLGKGVFALAAAALFAGAALAEDIAVAKNDLVLGAADAPVTLVEYASLTCPHCARFHTTTLPDLKKAFIDTGKLRYVYRDFPWDRLALTAALLPHCVGGTRAFAFLDVLYQRQNVWARSPDPLNELRGIARLGGVGDAAFDACLKNQDILKAIVERRLHAQNELKVNATPTLFFNGERYEGSRSFEDLEKLIESLLPKS